MLATLLRLPIVTIYRREFAGYSWSIFRRDLLAGLTVGAVALPLALAFGVASGANAAAGMVTAILAGFVIAGLGGAPFQISGPTGAMSAVLIVLAQRYGLAGIWAASLMAGLALVLLGVFRLGRYIAFIPSPVITGFTSGIALIIAIGQIDNVLGITSPPSESSVEKLLHYFREPPTPDWRTLVIAGIVALTMVILPRITKAVPGSLVGIALATLTAIVAGWEVPVIGEIPRTILLEERLTWETIPWSSLDDLLTAAVSIAALGAIETLLCGAVGANMTGQPMDANQELIGQGVGNMIIPFFGGVPATAAIARSSVGIKSGGATRMVSFVHAGVLLLSVFVLGPVIGHIPLAALGGVLMVTAWRMNEWESIHFFVRTRLKHALAGVLVTMLATVVLDLTQAILIGITISALIYLRQSAGSTEVRREPVSLERIRALSHNLQMPCPDVHVYYLTGPLFFGSVHTVLESFETARDYRTLVVSMRGVPLIDVLGVQALTQIVREQPRRDGDVYFSGVQPAVREMFARTGLTELVGQDHIFWSADQAIVAVHRAHEESGCAHCSRRAQEAATPA
nr:MAG: SulP family inorganic anion transporter [Chloroflexota bacterium]